MTRLLLADLRRNAGSWAWTCVVAVVAGACVSGQLMAARGSLTEARLTGNQEMMEAARVVSTFIISGVALAATAVLTSVSALAISQHERSHGLWRALGMRPGTLRAVLLAQLGAVGAVGALGGGALGLVVARLMLPLLLDQDMALPGASPQWSPLDLVASAGVVATSVILGGWGAARRASRAREVDLLAGRAGSSAAVSGGGMVLRVLGLLTRLAVVAGCVAGLVSVRRLQAEAGPLTDDAVNAALSGALLVLTLVCVLVSWLVPLGLRLVAALPLPGAAWQVASRTAALASRRSSATVMPFLVAIGLVAVFFGAKAAGFTNMRLSGFLSMFGLAFLIAWVGGVAVIAMGAGGRRRDAALLRAAGACEAEVSATQVLEGVLHAACAVVLGAMVSVGTSVYMAGAAGADLPGTIVRGPWTALGVVCGLTLVTTCLAVVVSARPGRRESVGQVLRARD